jgi:hypothetical protein
MLLGSQVSNSSVHHNLCTAADFSIDLKTDLPIVSSTDIVNGLTNSWIAYNKCKDTTTRDLFLFNLCSIRCLEKYNMLLMEHTAIVLLFQVGDELPISGRVKPNVSKLEKDFSINVMQTFSDSPDSRQPLAHMEDTLSNTHCRIIRMTVGEGIRRFLS